MTRRLPNWLDGFLEFTSRTDPCLLYKEWTAVSTIAAAMQRKVWLYDGRYLHTPSLYIVLVGPPAAKKGTSLNAGQDLLDQIKVRFASASVPGKGLIRELKEAEEQSHTKIGDQDKLLTHSSLTVFAQEFSTFVGRERPEFIDWLCEWFDCRTEWSDSAMTRSKIVLIRPWLNIIGATTEKNLKTLFPTNVVGGGLTSRIIFVYDSGTGKRYYETALTKKEKELRLALINDLEAIKILSGEMTWTPEARDLYVTWRKEQDENPPWLGPEFEYYVDRRMVHVCRVSSTMAAARASDMQITEEDVLRAIDLLERTEERMPRVFSSYGRSEIIEVVQAIQRSIIANRNGRLTSGQLLAIHKKDIHSSHEFNDILNILAREGFITKTFDPTIHDYIITYNEPEA